MTLEEEVLKKKLKNERLKEKYHNNTEYRDKKKQIAINHYYNKKDCINFFKIEISKLPITLYFN